MAEVITFGEVMAVIISDEPGEFKDVRNFTKSLAGAELNLAIGLRRLGHSVKYVTRLGADPYGDYILEYIKQEHLDTVGIMIDHEHLTGSYLKTKVFSGDPQVFYFRENSAASYLNKNDIEKINLSGVKIIHISGITAALSESCLEACHYAIEKAHHNGICITFDPNIRRKLWRSEEEMRMVINTIAGKCDIILPGVQEGLQLAGTDNPEEICDFYLNMGARAVVIKLGSLGAYFKEKDGKGQAVPGFKVEKIVDTVGAGDAFASGILSGILDGIPMRESVRQENAMGAIITASKSDIELLPSKKELESFMENNQGSGN